MLVAARINRRSAKHKPSSISNPTNCKLEKIPLLLTIILISTNKITVKVFREETVYPDDLETIK